MAGSALPSWDTPTHSRDSILGGVFVASLLGASSVFAFAPFSYSALWLLVFAGLAWLWQRVDSARRAFALGYVFGLAQFGVGVSWVHVSMHRFGGASLSESIFLTVLFVSFLALYPALVAWAYARLRRGLPLPLLPILFALLWWGGEALRSHLFTGFPWLLAGVAQVDGPWNPWLAWVGAPITGALLALIGAALGILLVASIRVPPASSLFVRQKAHVRWPLWVLGPFLALISVIPGLLPQIFAEKSIEVGEDRKILVRLLQYGIVQDQKWEDSQRLATLAWYREQTVRPGADLVLWPETAVPAFASNVSNYLHEIQKISQSNGSATLLGIVRDEADGYTNSIMGFGRASGHYDKRHLVPFGEYLPLKSVFSPVLEILNIPMSDFTAGIDEQDGIRFDGRKVGASVCYEVAYPSLVEQGTAGFLVTVSNDAWFGDSWAADQHLQIARARAAEHGLPMLRATNSGITAVIGPRGEVLARLPQNVPGVLEWELVLPAKGLN